ncbi:terminase small subunit [Tepidimicrobium xylanilyticum]
MKERKLTVKQKKFADRYIEMGNATQSYIDAGYSVTKRSVAEANARKLLGNYSVKKYIEERMKELEDKQIAKAEEVLKHLTAAMRGEIEEEVVVVEGIGEGESRAKVVKKQISVRDRIKAAELLGKRYALFTEKVDIEGNMGVVIVDDIEEDGSDEED